MCMRHRYAPDEATTSARPGSPRSAVTSLTSSAPSSIARRATSAFAVSIDIATPSSASSTGTTRRSSSSTETPSEPGRVDSPPMSTIAAPSSTIRRAEAIASAARKFTPPSENESGVTLTTPITDGRGKRSAIGAFIACWSLIRDQAPVGRGRPQRSPGLLDEPQSCDDRDPAHQRARADALVEDEHRGDDAEDRDEQRERGRPGGADPAHAFVEEDEREDRSEDREVQDRRPCGTVRVGELRPARLGDRERQEEQRPGRRGVERGRDRAEPGRRALPEHGVHAPAGGACDEEQCSEQAVSVDAAGRPDHEHEAREREQEPGDPARPDPLAEHRPGDQNREDRREAGDDD